MRIYLIAKIIGTSTTVTKHKVMDIDSREIREVTEEDLINAIKHNSWAFKNVAIKNAEDGSIKLTTKEGENEIPLILSDGKIMPYKKYILQSVDLLKNTATLISAYGKITDIDLDDIYYRGREIAYAESFDRDAFREIVNEPLTQKELMGLKEIDTQYKSFILTTRALGMDCSFKYTVNKEAIIMQSYTGSSKHAIVPKFIDVIDTRAFEYKRITDLSLNDGLKVIGLSAFAFNNLTEVDIPKTVTRICRNAFYDNTKLFTKIKKDGKYTEELDKDRFRVHNKETIIRLQNESW